MVKICTITCHDVYNHGASLQAFALMKYLEKQGHDVRIIDYKPDYLSNHYNLLSIANPKWEKNILTKLLYLLIKIPSRIPGLKRKKAFDRFTAKYLNLTNVKYCSNEDLKSNLPKADIYICGSDQIWNSLHKNGRDPAFYLDFVPSNRIKASYAASFATDEICGEHKAFVKEKVERLNGIAVREKSGVAILNQLEIHDVISVVDPVFLLNKSDWNNLRSKRDFDDKYIFVYDFDNSELIKKIAMEISNEKGYKIYGINPVRLKYVDKLFKYDGPETFISLIKNAEYVVSNSFHAAVFSIIFEKQFVIVNRKESLNTRMRDLLDDLGLNQRLVNEDFTKKQLFCDIDYVEPKRLLNEKINSSKNYLNKITSIK